MPPAPSTRAERHGGSYFCRGSICGSDFSRDAFDQNTKDGLNKLQPVIPAKAGTQRLQGLAESLDPSFRWDDDLFRCSLKGSNPSFRRKPEPSAFRHRD